MQFVTCSPYQTSVTPDCVTLAMSVLHLNAMMAQDRDHGASGLDESLLATASECVRDYIAGIGRFHPVEPAAVSHPPNTFATHSLDTQQIFEALQELARRSERRS